MEPGFDPLAHVIPVTGVLNLRELGGYRTRDGRQTLFRRLLRSDELTQLTPAGQQFLIDYGLRTVIDLRDVPEAAAAPDVFAASPWVAYQHRPFFDDEGRRAGPPNLAVSKGARYLRHLDLYSAQVAAIFTAIAASEPGVTLVHCAAGKDRTGLVAGLLLQLVGVPDSIIDRDYAMSEPLLAARTALLRAQAIADGEDMILFEQRAGCKPESMQEVLDGLRAKYGGAEGYLRRAGLSETEIGALRSRLLD